MLVIGDWNAKVGKLKEENVVGLYGLRNRNEAGDWFKFATPMISW